MTTLAVVLAAGGGRRFQGPGPKLLAPFRGRPLVSWAVGNAVASGLPTAVVHGAVDVAGVVAPLGATAVANPCWAEGRATSLQVGIAAAEAGGHDAVVVGLADEPEVAPEAWAAIAASRDSPMAVATYAGVWGHPVRLGAEVWPLLPRGGDGGARPLLRRMRERVAEVACAGTPFDVDTREDLLRWG